MSGSDMDADTLVIVAIAIVLFAATVLPYIRRLRRTERDNRQRLENSEAAGLNEPPTLHPIVDPAVCLCSGACVKACPEGDILGLISNRPTLLHASRCVGHGQCAASCPVDAISLVFGTAQRGIDIPHVQGNFETNVPGIYIVGELGGMGLIRNALRQGRQVVDGIAAEKRPTSPEIHDLLVVGGGPAGIAAALTAMEHQLNFIAIEQEEPGGAVRHYPRQKLVMTEAMDIPLYGHVELREASKERLLELWQDVFAKTGLQFNTGERLLKIQREKDFFRVETSNGEYQTARVVLAIGRRGTPRRLGVAGEELEKVSYKLLEPERFCESRILVVGGGNSALEIAWALAQQGQGNTVTLAHRSSGFANANENNRERIEALDQSGQLEVLLQTEVRQIDEENVLVETAGTQRTLENDYVFICIGGQLPLELLHQVGVSVERKFGQA
ncbi:MAG: thioredoxin reductase (NADPH) [Candidatus Latescibacterota bacterium]|jgi:thioredoxin reductase (NADPH)